ncbi:hypothetical protein SELMODRAFT_417050 [Selaginella moellendorffii]|uniref:Uncharacterized protein n=1 Tax=Selaginella moellendorffii TaxID=88036 RepID=D8S175_SELML|nr:hypothetical protein SELMODRAFT_417050 [Selaginella moellendorffii]
MYGKFGKVGSLLMSQNAAKSHLVRLLESFSVPPVLSVGHDPGDNVVSSHFRENPVKFVALPISGFLLFKFRLFTFGKSGTGKTSNTGCPGAGVRANVRRSATTSARAGVECSAGAGARDGAGHCVESGAGHGDGVCT